MHRGKKSLASRLGCVPVRNRRGGKGRNDEKEEESGRPETDADVRRQFGTRRKRGKKKCSLFDATSNKRGKKEKRCDARRNR